MEHHPTGEHGHEKPYKDRIEASAKKSSQDHHVMMEAEMKKHFSSLSHFHNTHTYSVPVNSRVVWLHLTALTDLERIISNFCNNSHSVWWPGFL
jgi:hypothetical protein